MTSTGTESPTGTEQLRGEAWAATALTGFTPPLLARPSAAIAQPCQHDAVRVSWGQPSCPAECPWKRSAFGGNFKQNSSQKGKGKGPPGESVELMLLIFPHSLSTVPSTLWACVVPARNLSLSGRKAHSRSILKPEELPPGDPVLPVCRRLCAVYQSDGQSFRAFCFPGVQVWEDPKSLKALL